MTDLPAPPVPAGCDLRTLPSMMLDLSRLFDSELYMLSTGDQFKAAMTLWGKAFHQVPAGSLPTNERVLAIMSGAGQAKWPRVREMVLRGWVLHSDGRLYHSVVTEKVLDALAMRQSQSKRAKDGWDRRKNSVAGSGTTQNENGGQATNTRNPLESMPVGDAGALPAENGGIAPALQLNRREGKEETGSLRSPAASAAGEGASPVPEQFAAASGVDLFGEAAAAAAAAAAEPKRPTAGSVLYGEGMAKLIEMTGRKRDPLAKWIGRMRKEGADDAMILALVQDAHRRWLDPKDELADPVGWISATVKGRLASKTGAQREVPVEAGGWVVKPIVDRCGDLLGADCEGAWPGFSLMLADALAAGADPDRHVYPAMRTAVRKGVRSIESAGWFAFSINGFRAGVAA